MSTNAGEDSPRRGVWRGSDADTDYRLWMRFLRRCVVALLAVSLLSLLVFAITRPFFHSNAHLVVTASGGVNALDMQPIGFLPETVDRFRALQPVLKQNSATTEPQVAPRLKSAAEMLALQQDLDRAATSPSDVLIVYIAAPGISFDGEAHLVCDDFDPLTGAGLVGVGDVLRQVAANPAGVKLVIFESGADRYDPRLQMIVNEFPTLLSDAVTEYSRDDGSLWVLNSHSQGEISHLCRQQRGRVFSIAVSEGLNGEADFDEDGYVSVGELHRHVHGYVSHWVEAYSDGEESQTPILLTGRGQTDRSGNRELLIPVREIRAGVDSTEPQPEGNAVTAFSAAGTSAWDLESWGRHGRRSLVFGWLQVVAPSAGAGTAAPNDEAAEDATGVNGDANAAPATDSAAADPATEADAEDPQASAETDKFRASLNQLWRLRDQLESRDRRRVSPIDRVPHLWRRFIARLERLESLAYAGRLDRLEVELVRLQRSMSPLFRWLGDEPPDANETSDPLGKAIIASLLVADLPKVDPWETQVTAFLDSETKAGFDKWLEGKTAEQFAERGIAFIRRWNAQPQVDWLVLREVLRCRLASRKVERLAVESLPWIDARVQEADRLRVSAERGLLEAIDDESNQLHQLAQAVVLYEQAVRESAVVEAAHRTHNDLVFRLPYYLRFNPLMGPSRQGLASAQHTTTLIESLQQLGRRLDAPTSGQIASVQSLVERLLRVQARIETEMTRDHVLAVAEAAVENGDSWQIRRMLEIPLLDAGARSTLAAAEPKAHAQFVETWEAEAQDRSNQTRQIPPGRVDWQAVRAQSRLEVRVAELCCSELGASMTETLSELKSLVTSFEGRGDSEVAPIVRRLAKRLQRFYQDLPFTIAQYEEQSSARTEVVRSLLAARIVDARDAWQLKPQLAEQWRRLEATAYKDWKTQRANQQLAFATAAERAAAASRGATVENVRIAINAPPKIDLETELSTDVTVAVNNRGAVPMRAWLIAHFDDRVLAIESLSERPIFRERTGAVRGDSPTEIPTAEIPPGKSIQLPLRISRTRSGMGAAGVAFKVVAVAASAATPKMFSKSRSGEWVADPLRVNWSAGNDSVRQLVDVALPLQQVVETQVVGKAGSWSRDEDGRLALHPYPNHPTRYRFSLANQSPRAMKVSARLAALPADVVLPNARVLSGAAASRFLANVNSNSTAASPTAADIELPNDGQPVVIPFPKLGEDGKDAADPKAEGDAEPQPPLIPVDGELLLLITDQATQQTTIERIVIRPQRPRRYVRPRAAYNAIDQKLTIRVEARDPLLLPQAGARAKAYFNPPLPPGRQARLGGVVTSTTAAVLEAEIPRGSDPVTVYVDIDDYPRAFLFRVDPSVDAPRIAEDTSAHEIRIVSPQPNSTLQAPTPFVAVELQIDAPVGSFTSGDDFAEVGIDQDRDSEFRRDQPLRLNSDRQSTVGVRQLASNGELTLFAAVSDHQVKLPANGLANQAVNILGRLQTIGRASRSRPRRVFLDSTGPRITLVSPASTRTVAIGEALKLEVGVTDDSGAGVQKVEVALDLEGRGQFSEKSPPTEATLISSGNWEVEVPATGALPGTYSVLVRATDRVGNVGAITRLRGFNVISAAAAARMKADATSKVGGVARYGRNAAANITMLLEPLDPMTPQVEPVKTDRSGRYVFPAVKAGEYQLRARGVIRNNPVTIKAEGGGDVVKVTVKPPLPNELPPLTLR